VLSVKCHCRNLKDIGENGNDNHQGCLFQRKDGQNQGKGKVYVPRYRGIDDNDGCSNTCLWEGSNEIWGSLCFNDDIEYGEECDYGSSVANLANSCTNSCLWITDPEGDTGSQQNVPVCGNGQVEIGEHIHRELVKR